MRRVANRCGIGVRFDVAVTVLEPALWSHACGWTELATSAPVGEVASRWLAQSPDWATRWTATCRFADGDVVVPVRSVRSLPITGRQPVRRFSWHRAQRHRSGLEYLVSTGRHHGYESLEEARLLLMLDFAGGVTDLLSQPMRLRFDAGDGPREHIPDFLADTGSGRWLIDVRPAGRIGPRDEVAFAAAAEVALLAGWAYIVVTGWTPNALSTVDTLSAQRRPLTDRLGMIEVLLTAAAAGRCTFGDLAGGTVAPAVARAYLLHLLWHRRLGIDLRGPLTDHTVVTADTSAAGGAR